MRRQHYEVPLERSDPLELKRHRNSCKPENFGKWLDGFGADKRLAVDLFSGAGGLSLGLERAGWTVAAAVDYDERALQTHAANFPGMSLRMDLGNPDERDRLVDMLAPAKIDLVAGGPLASRSAGPVGARSAVSWSITDVTPMTAARSCGVRTSTS